MKVGLGIAVGSAVATAVEVPFVSAVGQEKDRQISELRGQLESLQNQQQERVVSLQDKLSRLEVSNDALRADLTNFTGLVTLATDEATTLEAALELIIPTDSNGPGAKTAGAIYFIDGQLTGEYGTSGMMYMNGPFVPPGLQGTLTVEGITYPHGSPDHAVTAGTHYQYPMNLRYFWKYGISALQDYASTTYGSKFEDLTAKDQTQVLTDLWNNKPLYFNGIVPSDFVYELFFMAWSGFLTDPLYGGNRGLVGWDLVGFNGTNMGNFYGEGHSPLELALSATPVPLKPASLAQFQQSTPIL